MICSRPYEVCFDDRGRFSAFSRTIKSSILVPCGRCIACRIQHSREWATRILHEQMTSGSAIFTTLTYDSYVGSLRYKDLSDFWKRLRKRLNRKIKYFACGEYGEKNGRPHFHAIIFGLPLGEEWNTDLGCFYSPDKVIEKAWGHGLVFNGTCTYDSARYVASYILKSPDKKLDLGGFEKPDIRVSGGIGLSYTKSHLGQLKNGLFLDGVRVSLPRYYIKKFPELMTDRATQLSDETDAYKETARDYHKKSGILIPFSDWFNPADDRQRDEINDFQYENAVKIFKTKFIYDNAKFAMFERRN